MAEAIPGIPLGEQPEQPASIELAARSDTILYQFRGLFVGYAGLEYLNRVIQQSSLFDKTKTEDLNREAEMLLATLGRYNAVIEMISKNNMERLSKLSHGRPFDMLEEISIGLYQSVINDELDQSLTADQAVNIYMADEIVFWH